MISHGYSGKKWKFWNLILQSKLVEPWTVPKYVWFLVGFSRGDNEHGNGGNMSYHLTVGLIGILVVSEDYRR
jgi:hypothetical protein